MRCGQHDTLLAAQGASMPTIPWPSVPGVDVMLGEPRDQSAPRLGILVLRQLARAGHLLRPVLLVLLEMPVCPEPIT